jgi:hypothetical protein
MRVNENNLVVFYRDKHGSADSNQDQSNPDEKINMSISSGVLDTDKDFVPLQ